MSQPQDQGEGAGRETSRKEGPTSVLPGPAHRCQCHMAYEVRGHCGWDLPGNRILQPATLHVVPCVTLGQFLTLSELGTTSVRPRIWTESSISAKWLPLG